MASTTILDATQHLADQFKLMNSHVRAETALALLGRVIQRLAEKSVAAFSEAETQKLVTMFKLSETQLNDVLETSGYVFEQCAYLGASSSALRKELAELGLKSELGDAFATVWEDGGAVLRAALAERSICANQLVASDWKMYLKLGQQDASRVKKPAVILSLTTKDQDNGDKKQTTNWEFSHQELIEFSKNLDRIQAQLDQLN